MVGGEVGAAPAIGAGKHHLVALTPERWFIVTRNLFNFCKNIVRICQIVSVIHINHTDAFFRFDGAAFPPSWRKGRGEKVLDYNIHPNTP